MPEGAGIGVVSVVIDRWLDGTQRYDAPGESLLVARSLDGGRIVAIGGLTRCPHVAGAFRVRRFYVAPGARRQGVAGTLARQLIDGATRYSTIVTCNARASDAAAPFWETLGFVPTDVEGVTHRLDVVEP